jgi:hypothetical protein
MSGMKQLKKLIKKEWGISYKQIPKDITLGQLAETIACAETDLPPEEVYKINLGNEDLCLPNVIAFYISDEMGWNPKNVNATMTLGEILGD